jgi:hypothetical protein
MTVEVWESSLWHWQHLVGIVTKEARVQIDERRRDWCIGPFDWEKNVSGKYGRSALGAPLKALSHCANAICEADSEERLFATWIRVACMELWSPRIGNLGVTKGDADELARWAYQNAVEIETHHSWNATLPIGVEEFVFGRDLDRRYEIRDAKELVTLVAAARGCCLTTDRLVELVPFDVEAAQKQMARAARETRGSGFR